MGSGAYSINNRMLRASSMCYDTAAMDDIFTQNREGKANIAMNPNGVTLRESRDSKDHPNSVPIIVALDVTGSMGSIPLYLVREGLPNMMDKIIKGGVPDPQVLFIGIGDHECDQAPLQIGQFESNDEMLDEWLTKLWIEGNGGGNNGESYHLAWFFAGRYTEHDMMDKRKKKGVLFTIGDEPVLSNLSIKAQKRIMGDGQYSDMSSTELLDKAKEKYDCFHLHMLQGCNGRNENVQNGWKQIMGDNLLFIQAKEQVSQVIADKVIHLFKTNSNTSSKTDDTITVNKEEEIIL